MERVGRGILSAAGLTLMLGGCSTLGPNDNPAVPGNYRQLVVAQLRDNIDYSRFIKAEISQPGVWESPLAPSASRPIACARITVEGTFGPTDYDVGYKFVNGKIDEVFSPGAVNPAAGGYLGAALQHAVTCGKLAYSPLPELAKPKDKDPKAKERVAKR